MIDDATRIREIRKCLIDCGEQPTDEAIGRQFRYEVGRDVPSLPHRTSRVPVLPATRVPEVCDPDSGEAEGKVG